MGSSGLFARPVAAVDLIRCVSRGSLPESTSVKRRTQVGRERKKRISSIESCEGAGRAVSWGFPRGMTQVELQSPHWFSYKSRVIWWMEPCAPGVWAPHVAIDPAYQKRYLPLIACWREIVVEMEKAHGSGILVVVPPFGRIGPYLPRLGFDFNDEFGWWTHGFGDVDG